MDLEEDLVDLEDSDSHLEVLVDSEVLVDLVDSHLLVDSEVLVDLVESVLQELLDLVESELQEL